MLNWPENHLIYSKSVPPPAVVRIGLYNWTNNQTHTHTYTHGVSNYGGGTLKPGILGIEPGTQSTTTYRPHFLTREADLKFNRPFPQSLWHKIDGAFPIRWSCMAPPVGTGSEHGLSIEWMDGWMDGWMVMKGSREGMDGWWKEGRKEWMKREWWDECEWWRLDSNRGWVKMWTGVQVGSGSMCGHWRLSWPHLQPLFNAHTLRFSTTWKAAPSPPPLLLINFPLHNQLVCCDSPRLDSSEEEAGHLLPQGKAP
jgi:hypothetical protein